MIDRTRSSRSNRSILRAHLLRAVVDCKRIGHVDVGSRSVGAGHPVLRHSVTGDPLTGGIRSARGGPVWSFIRSVVDFRHAGIDSTATTGRVEHENVEPVSLAAYLPDVGPCHAAVCTSAGECGAIRSPERLRPTRGPS